MEIAKGAKNKTAVFFTFLSLLLVSFMILLFSSSTTILSPEATESSAAKTNVIDKYTQSIKYSYSERALMASSQKAFEVMTDYVYTTQKPYDDVETTFAELIETGEIGGVFQPAMNNYTLQNWSDTFESISYSTLGITTNIICSNIQIGQTDPWTVTVTADFRLQTNKSRISYDSYFTRGVNISILGKRDPLYAWNQLNNTICPTNISDWSNDSVNKAVEFISKRQYRRKTPGEDSPNAPSWLMRFGKYNLTNGSSCCGIESILNGSVGALSYNRSYVDYLFWNGTYDFCTAGAGPLYNVSYITGTPLGSPGFKLDPTYMGLYYLAVNGSRVC
jgi:hypothetical protein